MPRIAVSSEGPHLDARVDPRFGRAAGFVVVDPQTMDFEYIDNGSSQIMSQGAGIQAAEIVARTGADVVLTGFVGPKAFQALKVAGIAVGQEVDSFTVKEAIIRYTDGLVTLAEAPNHQRGRQ